MRTELIEKLEKELNYSNKIKGYTPVFHLGIDEVEYIIQALTSVESEANYQELQRRVSMIKSEPNEIVREMLIDNLFVDVPSVKSESAEEVLESIKKEAEGRYPYETHINKNDSPYLIHNSCFIAGAKWMHDFANADKKQHAIRYWQFMVENAMHKCSKKSDEELYNEYLNTLNNK